MPHSAQTPEFKYAAPPGTRRHVDPTAATSSSDPAGPSHWGDVDSPASDPSATSSAVSPPDSSTKHQQQRQQRHQFQHQHSPQRTLPEPSVDQARRLSSSSHLEASASATSAPSPQQSARRLRARSSASPRDSATSSMPTSKRAAASAAAAGSRAGGGGARPLPPGFFYEPFPVHLQCALCKFPFRDPVRFAPCGHSACRACIGDDLSQCPQCFAPGASARQPPQEDVMAALAVRVKCEMCTWTGNCQDSARHTCKQRQYLKAIRALQSDPSSARGWFMLGAAMKSGKTEEIAGVMVSKRDCYVNCLAIEPGNAMAWANLATTIEPGKSVAVLEERVTRRDCVVRALFFDRTLASAWFNLGNNMKRGEAVQVGDELVHKDTCYLRAVEIDRKMCAAWYNLGLCLDREMVIDFNGREYDAAMCFISAVLVQRDFAEAWLKLAVICPRGKRFYGRAWSACECAVEALTINSNVTDGWKVLERLMKVDELVVVGTETLAKEDVAEIVANGGQRRGRSAKTSRGGQLRAASAGSQRRVIPRTASSSRMGASTSSRPESCGSGSRTPHIVVGSTPSTPRGMTTADEPGGDDGGRGESSSGSCVVM